MSVTISSLGIVPGTNRTLRATWEFVNDKHMVIGHYDVMWAYVAGTTRLTGPTNNAGLNLYNDYTPPSNATLVYCKVKAVYKAAGGPMNSDGTQVIIKPSTEQSTEKIFMYSPFELPASLASPSLELQNGNQIIASVSGLDKYEGSNVVFYLHRDNISAPIKVSNPIPISTGCASCALGIISPGHKYKVRYLIRFTNGAVSVYSSYTADVSGAPNNPGGIKSLKALSSTSVRVQWDKLSTATNYEVEYATDDIYFDSSSETQSITVEDVDHAEVTGLEPGYEYFFRFRGKNESGDSGWSSIRSIKIGVPPTTPTTWSSTTTAVVGDPLSLHWMHNSEDASDQMAAVLELNINGTPSYHTIHYGVCDSESGTSTKNVESPTFSTKETGALIFVKMEHLNVVSSPTLNINGTGPVPVIVKDADNGTFWIAGSVVAFRYNGSKWVVEDINSKMNTTHYPIDTSKYPEGTIIKWRVKTRGIIDIYSNYSTQRTVTVYAKPSLGLVLTDSNNNIVEGMLTGYPFNIKATAEPDSQKPVTYAIYVSAKESYQTYDHLGREQWVNKDEVIYSNTITSSNHTLNVKMTPGDINLDNNVTYKVTGIVSMDSGLTAEDSFEFRTAWTEQEYDPQLTLMYNEESATMGLNPYCAGVSDVLLSVYRREYDGGFVEIAKDIPNVKNAYVSDPHPSLDIARYRVVATSQTTGAVSYKDIPGYPIWDKNVIIQWEENTSTFDVDEYGGFSSEPLWSGSMVKIPYNIDISEKNNKDVNLVKYEGREEAVSYYGTHRGTSSYWSMVIPKSDKETLYALRRLSNWMGDVYVREPSGIGYWASISVSFSQRHCEMTIPVSMEVTRVVGGV